MSEPKDIPIVDGTIGVSPLAPSQVEAAARTCARCEAWTPTNPSPHPAMRR
ncbi:MAG: hypothetical protein AAF170_04655 [Bacteroidota bacterium]